MLLVWCFCNKYFIVDQVFSDVVCILFFRFLLIIAILFFVIIWFAIITFLLVILVLVFLCSFFPEYFPEVSLEMSRFVAVMTLWYICTYFMPALFSFVPLFPASCAGTFIFRFYIKWLFIFSWGFCFLLFVPSVKFYWKFVTKSILSTKISTVVWYSSGKFNSMWVIISVSSICTSIFRRCPLGNSSSVIHSSGFLVMSSSSNLLKKMDSCFRGPCGWFKIYWKFSPH